MDSVTQNSHQTQPGFSGNPGVVRSLSTKKIGTFNGIVRYCYWSCRRPKALPNDRADVSQRVLEGPSKTVADESDRTDVLQGGMDK